MQWHSKDRLVADTPLHGCWDPWSGQSGRRLGHHLLLGASPRRLGTGSRGILPGVGRGHCRNPACGRPHMAPHTAVGSRPTAPLGGSFLPLSTSMLVRVLCGGCLDTLWHLQVVLGQNFTDVLVRFSEAEDQLVSQGGGFYCTPETMDSTGVMVQMS